MSWSEFTPSIVAAVGIPATAILTLWRENKIRIRQDFREDAIRAKQQEREDRLGLIRQDEWISQKWWERKASVYSDIVESLWQLVEYDNREYEIEIGDRESKRDSIDQDAKFALLQEHRTQLKKIADIGTFVISDEVAFLLGDYFQSTMKLPRFDTYFEYIDNHLALSLRCLDLVRVATLKDLGIVRE